MSLLGYQRASVGDAATASACWYIKDQHQSVFSIALEPARGAGTQQIHNRYAPGLHHVAFHVNSRAEVDHLYTQLLVVGAEILESPAEYDYTSGYYAVSLRDPDGLVLEFVYEPQQRGII